MRGYGEACGGKLSGSRKNGYQQDQSKDGREFDEVNTDHEKRESTVQAHDITKADISLEFGHRIWLLATPDITGIGVCRFPFEADSFF